MTGLLLALLTTAQEDLKDFRSERALDEREIAPVRDRLTRWAASWDLPEFEDFGGKVQIAEAREIPIYRVRVRNLEEHRDVRRRQVPYAGTDEKRRTMVEVDPWKPLFPPPAGFEPLEASIAVPGSEETRDCPACGRSGSVDCPDCRRAGKVPCPRCRASGTASHAACGGSGRKNCASCGGTGRKSCTFCGGDGRRGVGTSRRLCTTCGGSGKRGCDSCTSGKVDCGGCRSGKVPCGACGGNRQVPCGRCAAAGRLRCATCQGKGRLLESIEIAVAFRVREGEATVSRLTERRRARIEDPGQTFLMGPDDSALEAVPEPELREDLKQAVEKASPSPVGRLLARKVRLSRVPVIQALFRFEDRSYTALLTADQVLTDPNPLLPWARRRTEQVKELVAAGRIGEARRLAEPLARLSPDAGLAEAANAAVEEAEIRQAVEGRRRQIEEERSPVGSLWRIALFTLAGVIALTMIVLKLYLVLRRRARSSA